MSDLIAATITKPPAADRFHAVAIADFLTEGETVTTATVIASDPVLLIDRVTTPEGLVRWRVCGGVAGQDYIVTVTVTTDRERKEPVFIRYRVRQPEGAAA